MLKSIFGNFDWMIAVVLAIILSEYALGICIILKEKLGKK